MVDHPAPVDLGRARVGHGDQRKVRELGQTLQRLEHVEGSAAVGPHQVRPETRGHQGELADVGTGAGLLELLEVQPEGKGRQAFAAWRNGARPTADDRLGA